MRTLLALLALGSFLLPVASACAPPCGPIPAVIEIKMDKFRGLVFEDETEMVLPGEVTYYVNVDQDGWTYDPQNKPKITFKVNKQAPWLRTSVAPDSYEVPVDDPSLLQPEGSNPGDVMFYWSAPVTVTVQKIREPTAEELKSRWVRSDGTYRASVSASSTQSLLGGDVLGTPVGLSEGYGVRELRFTVEDGMQATGPIEPGGNAPAPALVWLLVAVLALVGVRRRLG